MKRRNFIAALACLPIVGPLFKAKADATMLSPVVAMKAGADKGLTCDWWVVPRPYISGYWIGNYILDSSS